MKEQWKGFKTGRWETKIDVEDFIQLNYHPYEGDDSFLAEPTERTLAVSKKVQELLNEERKNGGVLKVDATKVMSVTAFPPGYIDKDLDIIVGLQTDEPLKRGICPFGGIRMARQSAEAYGSKLDDKIEEIFHYVTTHNDGVFNVYSDEMKAVRKLGLITGLPDAYGRGSSSNISINIPSYINLKCLIPSSKHSVHTALSLSLNFIVVPTFTLLAGLHKHSHILLLSSFNINNSITALVSVLTPIILAGITLVSFTTKTSPLFK